MSDDCCGCCVDVLTCCGVCNCAICASCALCCAGEDAYYNKYPPPHVVREWNTPDGKRAYERVYPDGHHEVITIG